MPPKSLSNDHILDTATLAFAEKGFEGARVDAIADAAGVNKATLYYRIGDKSALYNAVIERMLSRMYKEMEAAVADQTDCREQLRKFIGVFARTTGSVSYGSPIMLREVASGGAHLSEAALACMASVTGLLHRILEQGVASGVFRQVNPFTTHMLIVGSLMFMAANAPIRRRIAERHLDRYADNLLVDTDTAIAQVCDLVLHSLRP